MRATLISRPWRAVTAALIAGSRLTIPTYLISVFMLPPIPPIVMIRSFVIGTALPALVAWLVLRAFEGTIEPGHRVLRLRRGDLEVEVPCTAIATVRPWWVALPGPGFAIRLRTGDRLPVDVAGNRPAALLDGLAACGVDTDAARHHPAVVYAQSRPVRPWYAPLGKFVLAGMLPAAILLYTHQHIAYGGTFGQWYLEGPTAYLRTLFEYWGTTVVLLVSYASFWRVAGELAVWGAVPFGAARVRAVRRGVEIGCALTYYGGVPVLLALRYLG
jgi:apolipoprotein N-acyltransferase